MKILHGIANLDISTGGPPRSCLGMARAVAKRGHDVTIVTTNRNLRALFPDLKEGPIVLDGVRVEAYPTSFPKFWETSLQMWRRLGEIVPQFDVVHLHSLYLFHDMVLGDLCRRHQIPYIVRPHGALVSHVYQHHRIRKQLIEMLFQNDVLRRAAGLHYATEQEWLLARPYALNDRGAIIPNGIEIERMDAATARAELRRRYPEIGEKRALLYLGRLAINKGIEVAIKAFAAVARTHQDVHLVLAGPDGGMTETARNLAASEGIGGQVTFTGLIDGMEKTLVLTGSDVFVFPSFGESFGIAVVEAASCGLPLVISDRVNIWNDFFAAGACLVAPPTAEAFAEKLRVVLDAPEEARRMADRARQVIQEKFAWESVAASLEAAYLQIVRQGKLPKLSSRATEAGA